MKFNEVKLTGFGKLVNRQFKFSPGFNLIYGKNEAGKSTLQRALLALLYGFYSEGRITKEAQTLVTDLIPWDGKANFGGSLIYSLDNGDKYQITASFGSQAETKIYNLSRKADITNQFRSGRQGRLYFAEEQLGVSKEVFENTCFVRQAELVALDSSASSITDALMRLSASASQESTAAEAIAALETSLKDDVGTARAYSKPLAKLIKRIEELEKIREKVARERQDLFNQTAELSQLEASSKQLQQELEKTSYLKLLAEIIENEKLLSSIDDAKKEVEKFEKELSLFENAAEFPFEVLPDVQRLTAQRLQRLKDREQAREAADRMFGQLESLGSELDNLYSHVDPSFQNPLKGRPAIDANDSIDACSKLLQIIGKKLEQLQTLLRSKQNNLEKEKQRLNLLLSEGIKGISSEREHWHNAEIKTRNAVNTTEKIVEEWQKFGISEDELPITVERTENEYHQWEEWASFRIDARDNVVRYSRRISDIRAELSDKQGSALQAEKEEAEVVLQIRDTEQRIQNNKHLEVVSRSVEAQIIGELNQFDKSVTDQEKASDQLSIFNNAVQAKGELLSKDRNTLSSALSLDVSGLSSLQQQWINQAQQIERSKENFKTAEQEWLKVDMPEDRFLDLQKAVQEIETGIRPAPKPRKGCLAKLLPFIKSETPQAPSELVLYAQIQPIYMNYARCRKEVADAQNNLESLIQHIRDLLGSLFTDRKDPQSLGILIEKVQNYNQESFMYSQKLSQLDTLRDEVTRYDQPIQLLEQSLRDSLVKQGIVQQDLHLAAKEYKNLCEQKEQYEQDKSLLEKLKLRGNALEADLRSWKQSQNQLGENQSELFNLLNQVGIQVQVSDLEIGVQQFEQGLRNFQEWQRWSRELDRLNYQVKPVYERLLSARKDQKESEALLKSVISEISKKYTAFTKEPVSEVFFQELEKQIDQYNESVSDFEQLLRRCQKVEYQVHEKDDSIRSLVDRASRVQELEIQLIELLTANRYSCSLKSLDSTLKKFEEDSKSYENWANAKRGLEQAKKNLENLQESLGNTQKNLDNLKAQASEITFKHSSWKKLIPSESVKAYEQMLQKYNREMMSKREDISRLQQNLNQLSNSIKHPAEIEEEIAFARKQLVQLQKFQAALENAKSELEQATVEFQRQFAPRLESKMMQSLSRITNNRYADVRVDPSTLDVSMLAPEKKEFIPARLVSTGTKDLIYLSLRTGIVQLMSGSGESLPMLLDDPFVQYDKDRQKQAFDYINLLTNEIQVFLFTKEDDLGEMFKNSCISQNNQIIEI